MLLWHRPLSTLGFHTPSQQHPSKWKIIFLFFFQSLTYCTYFINPFGKIGKKFFDFFRTSGNSVIGFRMRTNQHEETGCCSMLATCCYTVQSRRAGHDAITVATIRHNFQTIQFSPILVRIESRPYTFHKIYVLWSIKSPWAQSRASKFDIFFYEKIYWILLLRTCFCSTVWGRLVRGSTGYSRTSGWGGSFSGPSPPAKWL